MRRRPRGTSRPQSDRARAPEPDRKALDAMAVAAERARARLKKPGDLASDELHPTPEDQPVEGRPVEGRPSAAAPPERSRPVENSRALDAMAVAAERARAQRGAAPGAADHADSRAADDARGASGPQAAPRPETSRPVENSRALDAMAAAAERARARQGRPPASSAGRPDRGTGNPPAAARPPAAERPRAAARRPVAEPGEPDEPAVPAKPAEPAEDPGGPSTTGDTRRVGGFTEPRDDETGARRLVARSVTPSRSAKRDRTPPPGAAGGGGRPAGRNPGRPGTEERSPGRSAPVPPPRPTRPPPPAPGARGLREPGGRRGPARWALPAGIAFVLAAAGVAAAFVFGGGPKQATGSETANGAATSTTAATKGSGSATTAPPTTAPPATTTTAPPTTNPPATTAPPATAPPTTTAPAVAPTGGAGGSAPQLASVSPGTGKPGQALTISGSGFLSSNGRIVAYFGHQPAPTHCPSTSTCSVTVPDLGPTQATVTITVQTSGGTSNGISFAYR